jgi:MFS family permease
VNASTLLWLFSLYGIYAAATEGMIKAWIAERVPAEKTGTAIGFFNSFESIAVWLASGIAGMLWTFGNASLPFYCSAIVAFLVATYLLALGKMESE